MAQQLFASITVVPHREACSCMLVLDKSCITRDSSAFSLPLLPPRTAVEPGTPFTGLLRVIVTLGPTQLTPPGLSCLSCLSCLSVCLRCYPPTIRHALPQTRLRDFLDLGITRVSMGVQSFDTGLLEACGRAHSLADVYEAVRLLRQAKMDNFSIDLMR